MPLLTTSAYPFQPLGFVNVPTPGTPVQMSSNSLKCRGVTIGGFRAKGTANTGNIYVQDAQGNVLFIVPLGVTLTLPLSHPQLSEMMDLLNLYIDAAVAGDGAVITALV